MKNYLHAVCLAGFRQAQRQGFVEDHQFWMASPDGTQFSVIARPTGQFNVVAIFDHLSRDTYHAWLRADAMGTFDASFKQIAGRPPRQFQAITEAVPLPSSGSIYGIRHQGKITALQYIRLSHEGTLHSSTHVLRGSPTPDVMTSGKRGISIDPVKLQRLLNRNDVVLCDKLIGRSKHPVLWTKGSQNGRGNAIIVRDDWTGVVGKNNLAVYEYWQARGGLNLDEALRIGRDMRPNYR
jgi:hypothetical protein